MLAVCTLVMAATGCGPADVESGREPHVLDIAVIPKGTTHEFWKSIHAGAEIAARELTANGVATRIIWQGPLKEDDRDTQIQVVENFVTRGVAGIVLAPLDARALVRPVDEAVAVGIPVVIVDSGLESERIASFVATDNYRGGVMAAQWLAERLGDSGHVVLLRYAVGSASTEQREQGFLDELARHPGLETLSATEYAGPTRDTAYRTAQALLNRYGDRVTGVFAVNESATVGMTLALREAGLGGGGVQMVGFDAGTQSVTDLNNGDVQALVVQNPLRMGYEGVLTVVRVIRGEPVEAHIDTGVVLVTRENMDTDAMQALLNPSLDSLLDLNPR
jgi:ribose transport system substrate-binding protein